MQDFVQKLTEPTCPTLIGCGVAATWTGNGHKILPLPLDLVPSGTQWVTSGQEKLSLRVKGPNLFPTKKRQGHVQNQSQVFQSVSLIEHRLPKIQDVPESAQSVGIHKNKRNV